MRRFLVAATLSLFAFSATATLAAVPQTVAIEGRLLTQAGGPVTDGAYKLTFRLYVSPQGGGAGWTEVVDKVAVKSGAFRHALGSLAKLSAAQLGVGQLGWLSVQVGVDPELPRAALHATFFALRAGLASDVQCTGCVGVGEMKFDADLDLGGNAIKAKQVLTDQVTANKVVSSSFVGDGSLLTGLNLPSGKCAEGQAVVGNKPDGTYICAKLTGALPADGLDEVSNGVLSNEFVGIYKSGAPVPIADNDPIGVASELFVADIGTARKLTIDVDISNSDFGGVEVLLFAPDNSKYLLFSKDNAVKALKTSFPVPTAPVSGNLGLWEGNNPKGKWVLMVRDTAKKDGPTDGAINSWQITVDTLSDNQVQSKGLFKATGGLQLQVNDGDPIACTPAMYGRMYLNSKDNNLYICRKKWDMVVVTGCGDGLKQGIEQCDDGAKNSYDPGACRPDCSLPICGDKIVDPGESCDDGNQVPNDGCEPGCSPLVQVNATFTTCGATGKAGPSQSQCNSAYAGGELKGLVTVTGGIQKWVVPGNATYRIEVWGAQGALNQGNTAGAKGAQLRGDHVLKKGQVLKILVGQQGTKSPNANSASGGGGTFVVVDNNVPVIIAGGGGGVGASGNQPGVAGTTGECGTKDNLGQGLPGCNGAGGISGSLGNGSGGGGGGGLLGSGLPKKSNSGYPGTSFVNGGAGGSSRDGHSWGGFGGAGGNHETSGGGGGGGGYSGGSGGQSVNTYGGGGGGGSYNKGANASNSAGVNAGNGKVTIKSL